MITGFCGALTTFSTFSIEIVTLLQSGKWGMAMLAISIHLIGSLIFYVFGVGDLLLGSGTLSICSG